MIKSRSTYTLGRESPILCPLAIQELRCLRTPGNMGVALFYIPLAIRDGSTHRILYVCMCKTVDAYACVL